MLLLTFFFKLKQFCFCAPLLEGPVFSNNCKANLFFYSQLIFKNRAKNSSFNFISRALLRFS